MPSSEPGALREPAESAAARKYGLELRAVTTGFYDAVHRSNGRKVQVKSARYERADGPGVFRVWREHLRELQQVGGSVVCVVVNRENPHRQVLKIEKVPPAELLARGEFRPTGQADMRGRHEARIPWPELLAL